MSAQFGWWNFDGEPVDPAWLAKVKPVIAPFGPDDEGAYAISNLNILYRAFHTTKESRCETQPYVGHSGIVITLDGRLDNRAELIRQLRNHQTMTSSDVSIVTAAYEEWGTDCLPKLIGDWALSIWDANSRSLILAKDPIGTRHLYYSFNKNQVTWSTVLDALVLLGGKRFALCEEYIAGWFSFFPATHLTPYAGVHSVPPSSLVLIGAGKHTVSTYWDFNPDKRIRYDNEGEYEEHFRDVFAEAVRRRLRSDSPILAELSGGMDSSSIVCMADTIISRGSSESPRLDTISYFDDSEPHLNEFPYFTKVEEKRGRAGCHIDVGSQPFTSQARSHPFRATPGARGGQHSPAQDQFDAYVKAQGNRVLLSGIGGDEVTGGVPIPAPELEDLLARGHLRALARQLKLWALIKRKPWFHLLFSAARGFFPAERAGTHEYKRPASWLTPAFFKRNVDALSGYESRLHLVGPLPSFQENLFALGTLRRQIAAATFPLAPPFEKRYPFLDIDLLEFLYAVPREQLVRPGQRRSLMRRSLVGIVPEEILDRKRKAYVTRSPRLAISNNWAELKEISEDMVCRSLGIVDSVAFLEALEKARIGDDVPLVPLLRTLTIEHWLRSLKTKQILLEDGDNELTRSGS